MPSVPVIKTKGHVSRPIPEPRVTCCDALSLGLYCTYHVCLQLLKLHRHLVPLLFYVRGGVDASPASTVVSHSPLNLANVDRTRHQCPVRDPVRGGSGVQLLSHGIIPGVEFPSRT